MNIKILPPDINKSNEYFRAETHSSIRFGLKGLKNAGSAALNSIIQTRKKNGEFKSYTDFITGIELSKVNKAVLESLIKSGSLDSFGLKRSSLFASVEDTIIQAGIIEKNKSSGQRSLFTGELSLHKIIIQNKHKDLDEWTVKEIIKGEKEITGIYISQHPLEKYTKEISKLSNTTISEMSSFKGKTVKLVGVITEFTQKKSKKGTFYGNLFFEDLTGRQSILVFNNARKPWNKNGNQRDEKKVLWDEIKQGLEVDTPYYIEGQKSESDNNSPDLYLNKIVNLEDFINMEAKMVVIKIDYAFIDDNLLEKFNDTLADNSGKVPCQIIIIDDNKKHKTVIESDELKIKPDNKTIKAIKKIKGVLSIETIY